MVSWWGYASGTTDILFLFSFAVCTTRANLVTGLIKTHWNFRNNWNPLSKFVTSYYQKISCWKTCQRRYFFPIVFRNQAFNKTVATDYTHWTYWLQIHSKLCFQRVALSGNYEIVAIITDKNTFFNDLDYKADIGQHFHKSEKSARWRHRYKIIKTNFKTHISLLLTCT